MRISDWSSDVCSSDLDAVGRRAARAAGGVVLPARLARNLGIGGGAGGRSSPRRRGRSACRQPGSSPSCAPQAAATPFSLAGRRSEERRGGKECGRTFRSRWSGEYEKKKIVY